MPEFGSWGNDWWKPVLFIMVAGHLTNVCVTLFLHRNQTHQSIILHPIVSHFMRFWLWFTTSMLTKAWVAVHRKHHQHVETEHDPHSPRWFGLDALAPDGGHPDAGRPASWHESQDDRSRL